MVSGCGNEGKIVVEGMLFSLLMRPKKIILRFFDGNGLITCPDLIINVLEPQKKPLYSRVGLRLVPIL